MPDYHVYWGDFHTHLEDFAAGDAILRDARENIDFYAVLMYPFVWETKNGLRVETAGHRPEFSQWWETLRELAQAHHEPGRFVTFHGYEWNGNRHRYGDHNVIYQDTSYPYDPAWTLEELYQHMRGRQALVIPHHTGYLVGQRGKDWDIYDEALSPVMEIMSNHSSSEGCDTPRTMERNSSMGPRTSGGTFQDGLARGYRLGCIGSNDQAGLPGRWGIGRAAVCAEALTRESLWEAIQARRTYAVTGDRILLDFRIAGQPMGSVVRAGDRVEAEVSVSCSNALDRIELLQNGLVVDSYCHGERWRDDAPGATRFKVPIEVGWGPAADYQFPVQDWRWDCALDITGGRLAGLERCFSLRGGRVTAQDEQGCRWECVSAGRVVRNPFGMTQGLVVEIEGSADTRLRLVAEGETVEATVGDLLSGSRLVPLLAESRQRLWDTFHLTEAELGNVDTYYHNARKIKVHRAASQAGYTAQHTFRNLRLKPGRNYFYVRVSQRNGELAWSSPIWVDGERG